MVAPYLGRVVTPDVGLPPKAVDLIGRTVGGDGFNGAQAAGNIASAGPRGMIADAAPSLSTVLGTAMQRAGPGARAARQAIENRAAASNQDLTGALDNAFGPPPQGIQSATNDIRNGTAAARQAAYDAA